MPNLDDHARRLADAHTTMHEHQSHAINAGLAAFNEAERRRAEEVAAQRLADAQLAAADAGGTR
jgi:hypothetical protein